MGTFSNGTFTQSGGTNNVGSNLNLGYNAGSSGSYNLQRVRRLSASAEYLVGLQHRHIYSIGWIELGGLPKFSIGDQGRYQFSGGTLQVNDFSSQGVSTQWETRAS